MNNHYLISFVSQQLLLQTVPLGDTDSEPLQLLLELSDGHLPVQLHRLQHLKLRAQLGVLQLRAAQVSLRRPRRKVTNTGLRAEMQTVSFFFWEGDLESFLSPYRDPARPSRSSAGSRGRLALLSASSIDLADCSMKNKKTRLTILHPKQPNLTYCRFWKKILKKNKQTNKLRTVKQMRVSDSVS